VCALVEIADDRAAIAHGESGDRPIANARIEAQAGPAIDEIVARADAN
jgi:hypothetical protein